MAEWAAAAAAVWDTAATRWGVLPLVLFINFLWRSCVSVCLCVYFYLHGSFFSELDLLRVILFCCLCICVRVQT